MNLDLKTRACDSAKFSAEGTVINPFTAPASKKIRAESAHIHASKQCI